MLSKTHSKYIQSLHQKKQRDTQGLFTAEGSKVVLELIAARFACEEVIGYEGWLKEQELYIRKFYKGPLNVVDETEMKSITAFNSPSPVLAIFKKPAAATIKATGNIVLALDDIHDPGNLGTIIRTADWFGITKIVCSMHSVELYNPKVIQSTMGGLARVEVQYVELVDWLQQNGASTIYAAALEGKNIMRMEAIKEGIIVIGNESKGISEAIMQLANQKITIPRLGGAESLNAAIATGIILSHLVG